MRYDFDFERLIEDFLPPGHRTRLRVAWLASLCSWLAGLHGRFLAFFESSKNRMKWDGRKVLLERNLQLVFGPGIRIVNQKVGDRPVYMADCPSLENIRCGDAPFFSNFRAGDVAAFVSDVGFVIEVPRRLNADTDQMRAFVDIYLIGYVTYKIELV